MARHLPALRVVRAATVAARPRGRGGAGSGAPLWAPPRCAPLQSPAAPGARAGVASPRLARGGEGGSLQHLPLLPLPAAQIKKQQKATNHPGAQRLAARRAEDLACGARTQQATRMARHRLGRGAGLSGARLSSSGSARTPALAAASTSQLRLRRLCRRAARPPGQKLRTLPGGCRQNPDRTSGSLTHPPPPRIPSLLPRPPSQSSFGHLDAAGCEAGAAAPAPPDSNVLARSALAQLPRVPCFTFFPCNFTNK